MIRVAMLTRGQAFIDYASIIFGIIFGIMCKYAYNFGFFNKSSSVSIISVL